ncbi:hypothetical protein, partial [Paenibacillus oryzisoli]|uniref:hypothetical protein n=1 Tax=Paenibacillus oryzisoli TaxID=1850517 RepID=UPI001958FC8A
YRVTEAARNNIPQIVSPLQALFSCQLLSASVGKSSYHTSLLESKSTTISLVMIVCFRTTRTNVPCLEINYNPFGKVPLLQLFRIVPTKKGMHYAPLFRF